MEFHRFRKLTMELTDRRGIVVDAGDLVKSGIVTLSPEEVRCHERFNLIYRTLCAVLYNYVPTSGHPGGSISSSYIVASLIWETMDYDFSRPLAEENDLLSYAAGHKTMGLYAMWALRNEVARLAAPELLPEEKLQLRLEDLLGFRRNPTGDTPLFKRFHAKALDGHPTPATPFVKLATGASGVGVSTSFGLALGALDAYGPSAPVVHVLEGEGGLTPGRCMEAMAAAATSQLHNVALHLDWNQASIDSNQVCREGTKRGDYVQWSPDELFFVNDWNVIRVPQGLDASAVLAAQQLLKHGLGNRQPTAVVYRTVKGWKYGIEGKGSHGAGHKFCSPEFYQALSECEQTFGVTFPRCDGGKDPAKIEQSYYDVLLTVRKVLEKETELPRYFGGRLKEARDRLQRLGRKPRTEGPQVERVYDRQRYQPAQVPAELALKPGDSLTLRGALGDALGYLNRETRGAFLASAADLFGSTSITNVAKGFPAGFYHSQDNPLARLVGVGGICEDAMGGVMAGLSAFGRHIGVTSSYGAFIAALEHVTARLHAIGQQAKQHLREEPYHPFVIICAHAGVKTGEDGPTHADPQPLQLMSGNFAGGTVITLTPWEPEEVWPLLVAALQARPAVVVPFVTRPNETVPDRRALKLAPVAEVVQGVYRLRSAAPGQKAVTVVLQGSGVTIDFVAHVLPELDRRGVGVNAFYVSSAELFDRLPVPEQQRIFPEALAAEAMGLTDFTLPTLYRWVTSAAGRAHSLYPFRHGHFLGSGQAAAVMKEGGLDGPAQLEAILAYLRRREETR